MRFKSTYLLYSFPVLVWIIVWFRFSFDGLYGQDAYEYLRYTEALKSFFRTGKAPGDYFWGVYYPIAGSLLSFIIPKTAMALQLISVCSFSIGSMYLDKIIRLVYNPNALKTIPFLFFTLSPLLLVQSVLAMSDMLASCLTIVSIFQLLVFEKKASGKSLMFGITFAIMAVLTRYATAVILFPFCLFALIQAIKNRRYLYVGFASIMAFAVTIPHMIIRSQNSLQFLSHEWLRSWSVFNFFRANFITVDGTMHYNCPNVLYAFFPFFHPGFLVFGLVLLLFFFKKRKMQWSKYQTLFGTAIVLYAFFLAGIPFQNKRFLILSFPLIIVVLFPLLKQFLEWLNHRTLVVALIVLAQLSLAVFYGKPYYDRNLLERNIALEIEKYQGSSLYAFDIDIALKGRRLDFIYLSLWQEKHTDFEKNALLLINEKQLEKQWQGKNPMLNWETLQQHYHLKRLKKMDGDFNLYRIGERK